MRYYFGIYGYYILLNLFIFTQVVYLSIKDKPLFNVSEVLSLKKKKGLSIYLLVVFLDAAVVFVLYGSALMSAPIDIFTGSYGGIIAFTLLPTLPVLAFVAVSRYFSNLALLPLFLLIPVGFLYPFVTIMGGSISIFALYCLSLVLTLIFYIVLAHKRSESSFD